MILQKKKKKSWKLEFWWTFEILTFSIFEHFFHTFDFSGEYVIVTVYT